MSVLKPATKLGEYKIIEFTGHDDRAALYLVEKEDPEFRYWALLFEQSTPAQPVSEGQEWFDYKGQSCFVMPTSGTTAATLSQLVKQTAWQFLAPRFAKVTEEMAVRHDKNQTYQGRGSLGLENFFFNSDGAMMLYPSSRLGSAPILPPEGTQVLTPAADVYVVGQAFRQLLGDATGKNALKPNRVLEGVLARATATDPAHRYSTAAALALAFNGIAPSARANEQESTIPWLTGCLIPLIVLLVLGVGGFYGFQTWQGQQRVAAVTATALRTANLVLITPTAQQGVVSINDLSVAVANGSTMQFNVTLSQDGAPLNDAASFTILLNDEPLANVQSAAVGQGRYTITASQPLGAENFFKVTAFVGNKSVSRSVYYYNSAVTGIDFETGGPTTSGGPGGGINPSQPNDINPPNTGGVDGGEIPAGDLTIRAVEAQPIAPLWDTVIQVDTSGYPQLLTYFSFRDANGQPVRMGGTPTIDVYQDGAPVRDYGIVSVDPTEDPLTVALLIDISGSMEGQAIVEARNAAIEFIRQLRTTDSACLYSFATQITLVQECSTDHEATIAAIGQLVTVDDTSLYDALIQVAADQTSRPGRQAIVVLSDGADTVSQATLDQALTTVKESNIPLYIIGLLSEQFDGTVLSQLATETSGVYLQTPSSEQLQELYLLTETQLQNQYRLTFDSLYSDKNSGNIIIIFKDGETELQAERDFYVQE